MRPISGTIVSILLALLLGALPASAEVAETDPPARVGRLSVIEGTVSTHRANEDQWSAARRNAPVTSGDSYWTEPGSRAEIQIGPTALRMDEASELDILRLDDRATEIDLKQGTIAVSLRAARADGVRILTPRGEVVLTQKGSYRIDAGQASEGAPPEPVEVTVLDGFARVHGARGTLELHRGESARIDGDPAEYSVGEAEPAPIDEWAQSRERRVVARNSGRHVPEDMTGYEDLDQHGRWRDDPTYGAVWYPAAVPVGWAPYRYGHWAYVAPWGWTWIDDAPWGFAPFHYGRWAYIGGAWGWCPGTFVAQPVYAPALVAFVGGSNWGISLSIGAAIGWLPLAPFEVYSPYYPASVTYVKNVNITNVNTTVINNISRGNAHDRRDIGHYKNRDRATVVSERDFTNGRHVREAALRVPRERLAHAPGAQRLDHLRPEGRADQHARGPAIRREDGRPQRDGRGDAANAHDRRDRQGAVQGDRAAPRDARIDPRAGRNEESGREDRRQAPGSNAASRDSRDGAAPGPRINPRDARTGEAGSTRPEQRNAGAANDRPQSAENRGSRAPGSPVTRRDDRPRREDRLARDTAPNDATPRAARGAEGAPSNGTERPSPNSPPQNRAEPRVSNAAPGPANRSTTPNAPGTLNAPGAGAPEAGVRRGTTPGASAPGTNAPGPRSAREEPSIQPSGAVTRAPRESTGREQAPRMPPSANAAPQARQRETRQAPGSPVMRPPPSQQSPSARPAPQSMPRELMPNMAPNATPRMAPPQASSRPSAPVTHAAPQAPRPQMPAMQTPRANQAPRHVAQPPAPQPPQGAGPQGQPERRRHGSSP